MITTIEYLDSPPAGWHVLDVLRVESRKWDWVALMVSVPSDELKFCRCTGGAMFYVKPNDYHPGDRVAHHGYVRIRGKHRNRDAAWDALDNMLHIADARARVERLP